MRLVGASTLAIMILAATVPAQEPTKKELLLAVEKQLKAANETAGPAVACVVVSRSNRYPKSAASDTPGKLGAYDLKEFLKLNTAPGDARVGVSLDLADVANIPDNGYACGVVIDAAGLVLTPYHVVEGATKVYVHLPGRVGAYADIHAADARHDLAVLKLINPPPGLATIKFADVRLDSRNGQRATVSSGKLAVLVANAYVTGFTIDKPSAALGSITNVRFPRTKELDKSRAYYLYGPLLEHDAKLNAGVDGAALLNLDGELMGLTTSSAIVGGGERGPHFAFPADANFRRVVEILRRGEEVEYGYLGVSLNSELENLQITTVVPRGPAGLAGLQGSFQPELADHITHVNDVPINTYEELLMQIGSALAGSKVKLTVLRARRSRDVDVTLGKFVHKQPFIASVRPDAVFGLRVEYSGMGAPEGVSVREVTANSPAEAAFKKLGGAERWIITHVNGTAVATPAEFYKAAKGQASVKLTVIDPNELNRKEREVPLP